MDLLKQLNRAMEYVEEHICNDIALVDISKVTTYSPYHFGRLFYYITDMPLSEYIRKRKLSLAAVELLSGDVKVIDLAVKYGYDSADSFTRAFVKQHGVTPTIARKPGIMLKLFPPLTFQITIKGVREMNWRIEEKESFDVFGVERYFKNDETDKISGFWSEMNKNGVLSKLTRQGESNSLMGFCGHIDENADEFPYMICLFVRENSQTEGFKTLTVPMTTWAIFKSDLSDTNQYGSEIPGLFKRAYTEWLPSSGYEKADSPDLEIYGETEDGKHFEEIWIPILRK